MVRKVTTLLTILASILFYAFASAVPASADPGGNNGDVKVHDTGTAVEDHRTEPHVCTFYIDGFNFDGGSSGTWRIEGWAPTGSGVKASGTFGPADGSGNWRSSDLTLADGHYKLFVKQTAPGTPGGEKQKVFWVECSPTSSTGPTGSTGPNDSTGQTGTTIVGGITVGGTTTGGAVEGSTIVGGTTAGGTTTSSTGATIFGGTTIGGVTTGGTMSGGTIFGGTTIGGVTTGGIAVAGFQAAPSNLPGGSNQLPPGAVQGAESTPLSGLQGLPSTSTEGGPAFPLAIIGFGIMGLGGALFGRRDTRI